jgi:molybdenum cofactor guanylyltransferase
MKKLPLTGIVLAGGQSRRFGQDKSLALINDKPLIEHVLTLLNSVCDEILISVNDDKFRHLPFTSIADKESFGPLSGILATLPAISHRAALIIPTDTPHFNTGLIEYLYNNSVPDRISVAFNPDGQMEPLCAIYPKSLFPAIREIASNGERKLAVLIKKAGFKQVSITKDLPFYTENLFLNINRPEDLSSHISKN